MTNVDKNSVSDTNSEKKVDKNLNELPVPDGQWSCELQKDQVDLSALQVGDLFRLHCEGDALGVKLNEQAQFLFQQKKSKNTLKIIEVTYSDYQKLQAKVTGYKPGNYTEAKWVITDGTTVIASTQALEWKVNSLFTQKNPPPEKPIGPMGPLGLSYPWWYWGGIGGAVLAVILIGAFRWRKSWKRKKLIEGLKEHQTALGPYNQFHKEIRLITRKISYSGHGHDVAPTVALAEIEKSFRLYLMRQFLVPAEEWSDREILKDIKKQRRKLYEELSDPIQKLLKEYRSLKKSQKLNLHDCQQLTQMTRRVVDKIDVELKRKKKRRVI